MIWLTYLFLGLTLLSIIYYGFAIYTAWEFFQEKSPRNNYNKYNFYPPVSILKPICGLEWEIEASLSSFCQQNYHNQYQVIFSVQNSEDPCLEVLEKIKNDYPSVDITIVTNEKRIGNNFKISNLANALKYAKYSLLVIADSDIQVQSNYLQEIVQPMQDKSVGLVTCLYTSLTKGFLAGFESLEISTQFHPRVLTARKIEGISYAFGATILIRRQILQQIGGFKAIADYLADDYQLGNLVAKLGYQVILSNYIVTHRLADVNWRSFFHRQSRWAKCVRVERFWGYLGLIFTQGTVTSLCLLIITNGSPWSQIVLLITWGLRWLMAMIVGVFFLKDEVAKKYLIWLPIRDLVSFLLWVYNLVGNTINWRNYEFTLIKDGKLVKL